VMLLAAVTEQIGSSWLMPFFWWLATALAVDAIAGFWAWSRLRTDFRRVAAGESIAKRQP
jgi:hypothetical protein